MNFCLLGQNKETKIESTSVQKLWEKALGELQLEVNKPNYRTFLEKTVGLSYENNKFVIGVPNIFVAEYLEKNQRSLIERTLINILHQNAEAFFRVSSQLPKAVSQIEMPVKSPCAMRLKPAYTFENFVVGDCNRLAHAAALEAVRNAGRSYNPLFIYGGVGLGKTHLLQAIGHMALAANYQVLYASGEDFTNEFITAVQEKKMGEFRARYRRVDVLLIDDIQFIIGKEQTEECFFHTFNELHNGGHQIVLTSDKSPKDIPKLACRLRSRFEWGLTADVRKPDLETRLAILKAKAEREGTSIDPDTLSFIAQRIKESIRELEGSLNRVVAYAKLLKTALSPEIASAALSDIARKEERPSALTPAEVIEVVATAFQLQPADITGRRRDKESALARGVAMYLLRRENSFTLAEIGKELGGRNPNTVSHAYRKIEASLDSSPYVRRKVETIYEEISQNRGRKY